MITEVVQVFPDAPDLNPENINSIMDGLELMKESGMGLECVEVETIKNMPATVYLKIQAPPDVLQGFQSMFLNIIRSEFKRPMVFKVCVVE